MPSACSPVRSATPANNVLFYVKGGAAVTSDRYRVLATGTGVQLANSVNDTRWGGAVGVGLEYGFAPNWSVGIEYNHLFMQDKTYNFVSNGAWHRCPGWHTAAPDRIRQDVDIVTARINYTFGRPGRREVLIVPDLRTGRPCAEPL